MTPEHTDMTGAARLREALEALRPFAGCTTTEDGEPRRDEDWPPMTERIVDWFGWSDFRAAVAAFDAIREALAAVPEAPESQDDLLTVTLRRGQWMVILGAASDYGKRVPLEQGDGGACLDAIREALGERVEEGTEQ